MFGFRRKNKIKISIITWDGSFRESFHTVDTFGGQDFSAERFEFIWVDFYNNQNPNLLEKISKYANARILNLNNDKNLPWHLGKCLNAGIKEARGNILVIPDGDVIVSKDLLNKIEKEHEKYKDLVLYFRRWDEPADFHDDFNRYDINYLEKVCVMYVPTNYGGLISTRKQTLASVNNYEESKIFSGPGANGLELYIRLRNKGFPVKWHQTKIFHPYHANTGVSYTDRNILNELSKKYHWINPYAGIAQSWVLKSREMDLSYWADEAKVDKYLSNLPEIS